MNSEVNAGTYWSAGELRTLNRLSSEGRSAADIAYTLRRSIGGVKQRQLILRTAQLFQSGLDTDTLVSTRKDPQFNFGITK